MGSRVLTRWPGFVLAVALALALAVPAHAAFPGKNGKIAFSATNDNVNEYPTTDLYSVNPDGSGLFQIIDEDDGTWEDSNYDDDPEWSPDGARLAFTSHWVEGGTFSPGGETIDADGTGRSRFRISDTFWPSWSPDGSQLLFTVFDEGDHGDPTTTSAWISRSDPDGANTTFLRGVGWSARPAAWSPDGTRMVFGANGSCSDQENCPKPDLYTASPDDGSGLVQLTNTADGEFDPDWSPDGSRIVFTSDAGGDREIYTMNADGTGVQQLTSNTAGEGSPSWSPDGTKIAFDSSRSPAGIYVMNADGSDQTFVIEGHEPDWQPLPYTGYARPKAASPVEVPLVPAYRQCTAPNRTHGPPLGFHACHPPLPESDWLTVGTPDANGAAPRSIAAVKFQVLFGDPATAINEADVRIRLNITDVRNTADLSDYAGEIQVGPSLVRITDRDNASPSGGGSDPGTMVDIPVPPVATCATTADPGVGGTCDLLVTLNAIVPGMVKERQRAIWEFGAIEVYDGGADGDAQTTPNTLFMRQGIFVP